MRPIFPHSTDLLYKGPFENADLIEVGNALGVSDLKIITTATLKPERVFFHACLNGIQTFVRLHCTPENERAQEIAALADQINDALFAKFMDKIAQSRPLLESRQQESMRFCAQLHAIEGNRPWDKVRFQNTWNVNDYPPRWQKKAIECYGTIRERMERGEYTPAAGWDAGKLTQYWATRNVEYKFYRDAARGMIEDYIMQELREDQRLTMHPSIGRTMTMFIGGMASGKSAMTEHHLSKMTPEQCSDLVLHNADYLKYALYRSAAHDGMFPEGYKYLGQEVQAESSNALYEGTRKRAFIARQKFHAPSVVLNSIVLGSFEVQEGIAGGGKVIAHHLHITPEEAIAESEKRRKNLDRVPADADIRWSAKASAQSLLMLSQPEYRGTDVTLHLYEREAGRGPRHYATIDANKREIHIEDIKGLQALSATAELGLGEFLKAFTKAGYVIHMQHEATLPSAIKLLLGDAAFTHGISPAGGHHAR